VKTSATADGVVTVVDALALVEGRIPLDDDTVKALRDVTHDDPIEEVFEDQLACADLVVLSKSDLVTPAQLEALQAKLAARLRPNVRIVPSHGALAPSVLIGLGSAAEDDLAARVGHHAEGEEHDHDDFDSIVVTPQPADTIETMRNRVGEVLGLSGVLRVKGHARVAGKPAPVVVQAVGARIDLAFARPDAQRADHLVVIGLKGFDTAAARAALAG
jgi:cobalamin biosynthesis protein CobW